MINAKGLAAELGVSGARVSQWLSEGKLDGCYTGEGRARRFDLGKCRVALQRGLDAGQMLGNGAATRAALVGAQIAVARLNAMQGEVPEQVSPAPRQRDGAMAAGDPDRYQLARTQVAEEEARTKRRQNMQAEGQFVLVSEVERVTAQMVAQEVAEFEAVLRRIARRVADVHGLDFKAVRMLAIEEWRGHRGDRAAALGSEAQAARLSEAETAADF